MKKATFAGGCFWCMEAAFKLKGLKAVSGYTAGTTKQPNYQNIGDHIEAVQLEYDPEIISYEDILDIFWKSIDPTDDSGQFADRGNQYKTAIFYHDEEQRKKAEESKKAIQKEFDKPIATRIIKASTFYKAEEYHQDYYKKNLIHYNAYAAGSGRKGFLKEKWGE